MNSKDTWQFNIGKGKKITKVVVHLDLDTKPSREEIANGLVCYISALEDIKRKTAC